VGAELPAVRAQVARELRRRTLDRDQAIAAMIRIADRTGMRIGSEAYAEENHTHGLSTLMPRHVRVDGKRVDFDFPAKGGRRARCTIEDAAVARIVSALAAARRRRLFVVDREPVDAESVNESLAQMSAQHITAKDLRTWHGTRAAFRFLLAQRRDVDTDAVALQAIDAAADALANTRAVARAHYVHPRLLDLVSDGAFAEVLRNVRPSRASHLTGDERLLIAVLRTVG
jgi:DNA topoisomerase-1